MLLLVEMGIFNNEFVRLIMEREGFDVERLLQLSFTAKRVSHTYHFISEAKDEVRRGTLGKFLCDSDQLNLNHILSDIVYRDLKPDDLFNAVRGLSDEIEKFFAPLANDIREAYAVVVVAVVLLSYVYLYLTGCGGWGCSRAVSSRSLDYRDTYIAIVLFRGAYVWIKFRDVASTKPKGVRLLATGKYELRFKPHRENGVSFDYMHIGRFDSKADAEIVHRMIVSCYPGGEDCDGLVDLAGDGRELFPITPEFSPEEQARVGKAKHNLVKKRVLEHYKRYKTQKDALDLPPISPGANLEQELQNRRLQKENEDLVCKLQQSRNLQQALQFRIEGLERQLHQQAHHFQFQNSQLPVEDLQRPVQDQQAQQNLQQAQQFQVPNLQPQTQLPHLQSHQRGEESFDTEPFPQDAAEIDAYINMEQFLAVPGLGAESTNSWGGGDIPLMDATTT